MADKIVRFHNANPADTSGDTVPMKAHDNGDGTFSLATTATMVGGGDASAANQTAIQANAGAQASKANAVQGITGGVPIPVSFSGGGDASAANQATQITAEQAIQAASGAPTDAAASSTVAETATARTGIGLWKGIKNILILLEASITSLIALLPAALGTGGGLKIDGSGTVLPVSLATAPALVAGEAHIGEVGGNTNAANVEFTRESNATPYAAGDVISSSAGSPVLLEIPNAVRINGGSAYVTGLAVVFNVKSVTPRIRVHFFNASPAAGNIAGDNLPLIEKYADASKRLRYVELPAMITAADATNSDMSRSFITANGLGPENGVSPVTISYKITPSA